MATLSFYSATNMDLLSIFYGKVINYSSKQITVSNGFYTAKYYGSFSFSSWGLKDGKVTGFEQFKGNTLQIKLTNGNYNALIVEDYVTSNYSSTLINYITLGNDTINGSSGDDTLGDYEGNDKLFGNAGNDILDGNSGNDTLEGGTGNDQLFDYSGNNLLNGGDGNDSFYSGTGNDVITGDNGIDTVYYNSSLKSGIIINLGITTSQNTINAGFDTFISIENIEGSTYSDTITGNTVDNTLTGNAGNDKLTGNAGNDLLIGGADDDALNGGDGNDLLNGGIGSDWAQYWNASSALKINLNVITPQNTLGAGIDTLIDIEKINASYFNDAITGNSGNNSLLGNAGNDTLTGGDGNDILTGGEGSDIFVFNTALNTNNIDNITDFIPADDSLQLAKAIFTKLTSIGNIQSTNFKIGTRAEDNNDFLIYTKTNGLLSYDADGNGHEPSVKIAYLGTHPELTFQDFLII